MLGGSRGEVLRVAVDAEHDFRARRMARVDDEKLVLHVRERLVVHDLLEEAFLGLGGGGQSLDGGCPGVKGGGVEGVWEERLVFSCHLRINADGGWWKRCQWVAD
jgi:hypothetical protein